MKTLTNKLFLSLLTVALTVIALGTTTFAWFTLTNTASVNPFEVEITAGQGIEISFGDSGEWASTITTAKMTEYLFTGTSALLGTEFRLNNVTSPDGTAFRGFDVANNELTTPFATYDPANGYIEFELKFRSMEAVTINWTEVLLDAKNVTWKSDVDMFLAPNGTSEINLNDDVITNPIFGARVSVTNVTGTPATTVYEFAGGAFEDSDEVTAVNTLTNASNLPIDGGSVNYFFVKNSVYPVQGASWNTTGIVLPSTVQLIDGAEDQGQDMLTLAADATPNDGYTHRGSIMVRIWIEGWDLDTYNSILGQAFNVSFKFEIKP